VLENGWCGAFEQVGDFTSLVAHSLVGFLRLAHLQLVFERFNIALASVAVLLQQLGRQEAIWTNGGKPIGTEEGSAIKAGFYRIAKGTFDGCGKPLGKSFRLEEVLELHVCKLGVEHRLRQ
jgi:hypothetical protein